MSLVNPREWISSWRHGAVGLQHSSDAFYSEVERAVNEHNVDHVKIERVLLQQGGMFSAKREYLQVRRKDNVFLICAAPFGNVFFVSWWLGYVESSIWATLAEIPLLGFLMRRFIKPPTLFVIDTTYMFQSIVHSTVSDTLNAILTAKGLRTLSETERAPVMSKFFTPLGEQ